VSLIALDEWSLTPVEEKLCTESACTLSSGPTEAGALISVIAVLLLL
jgi:hypothetical protein